MDLSLIPGMYRGEFTITQRPVTGYHLVFEILSLPELAVFKRYVSKSGFRQETDARIFGSRQAQVLIEGELNLDLYEEDRSLVN